MLEDLKVIDPPDDTWLERLRRGHFAWAVKEKKYVQIVWAYEPPNPGCIVGRIGLKFCNQVADGWITGHCQEWYTDIDGRGMDRKPILQPVEGNCPDHAPEISDVWQRYVEKRLNQLTHHIDQLQRRIEEILPPYLR